MNLFVFRSLARPMCAATVLALLAGCSTPLDIRAPKFWEGSLEPRPGTSPALVGLAAMVANPNDTRAVVTVEDPPLDLELSWNVRTGGCDGEGTRIAPQATFPPLRYSDDVLTASALVFRRIDTVGTHAAEVYAGENGTGEVLACADLLQVDAPSGL